MLFGETPAQRAARTRSYIQSLGFAEPIELADDWCARYSALITVLCQLDPVVRGPYQEDVGVPGLLPDGRMAIRGSICSVFEPHR